MPIIPAKDTALEEQVGWISEAIEFWDPGAGWEDDYSSKTEAWICDPDWDFVDVRCEAVMRDNVHVAFGYIQGAAECLGLTMWELIDGAGIEVSI